MKNKAFDIIPLSHFFERLRQNDFPLGIEDYQTLLNVLQQKFGLNIDGYKAMLEELNRKGVLDKEQNYFPKDSLLRLCKLLWLKPNQNEVLFEDLFYMSFFEDFKFVEKELTSEPAPTPIPVPEPTPSVAPEPLPLPNVEPKDEIVSQEVYEEENFFVRLGVGQNKTTQDFDIDKQKQGQVEKSKFIFTENYFPIDRRKVRQNLKKLPDFKSLHNSTQIDISATIAKTIEKGIFTDIVWQKLKSNTKQVLLLIDNGNSMTAFSQLAEIIKEELSAVLQYKKGNEKIFRSLYFYNAASAYFFSDKSNTMPFNFDQFLNSINKNQLSVIIISDAGAAIGGYQIEAELSANTLVSKLYHYTKKIAWLNPLPAFRWQNTSAIEVAKSVAMFEATENGLKNAIHFLKGSSGKTIQHT